MTQLTLEEFRDAMPAKWKKTVNQELIDQVNTTLADPTAYEAYRDNLISYTSVMADGKFKIEQYLDAVRYVSFKLLGNTNIDAYMKTFPARYQAHLAAGTSAKDIASYVSAYNKGKLVNLIFEQTIIPSYVLNQDMYQKALNVQAELMVSAHSEKVRSDAANSILTHLKAPEVTKVKLDIGLEENSAIQGLMATMHGLAAQQQAAIESRTMNAQQVAHSKIERNMGDAVVVGP